MAGSVTFELYRWRVWLCCGCCCCCCCDYRCCCHDQVTGNYKILGRIMQEVKATKDSKKAAESKARKEEGFQSMMGAPPGSLLNRKQWVADDHVTKCTRCQSPFTFLRRKHHCRLCGRVFCNSCSPG